jgi:amino acid adenylation domain-containing protein
MTAAVQANATLLDLLLGAAEQAPEQVIVHVRGDGDERVQTYRELRDESLRVAGGYVAAGIEPGGPVIVLADRSDDFLPMFWGALAAGLVPVPLASDATRVRPVWDLLGRAPVVVDEAAVRVLTALPAQVRAVRLADLRKGLAPVRLPTPPQVAFLQFSSGSTGAPRGVELTHANVLANLDQARAAAGVTSDDVLMSWMPYFHDMGLIGTHLMPLAARIKQVKLGPLSFAKRPGSWFEVADRHSATLLSAANFALALVVRRVPDEALAGLDLRSVRFVGVGAEPISPAVWAQFQRKLQVALLDPRALQPVYGLAEATLGVTCPPLGEIAVPLLLDRSALSLGAAVDAAPGTDAVAFMDVGFPVPGCAVRIVGGDGTTLGERRVGQVEVRGPNVARGYHRAPEETSATFVDGWLRTGDLGFLRDGRLCVTGRDKDVIFVNGRKFHAPDLEEVVAATPGLPSGLVAVIGSTDPTDGRERVVVMVQSARPRSAAEVGLLGRVRARVRQALGHDDVRVLPLPPGAFPRTTSGKLQRRLLRDRFEAGSFAGVEAAMAGARADCAAPAPTRMPVPRRGVERTIMDIWARVLDRPAADIGLHDRFMAIGGSSVRAMEVLVAVEEAFAMVVHPAVLHDCDTVAALADHVLAGQSTAPRAPGPTVTGAGPGTAVAVLAMACRFPGADTPEEFWAQLTTGHDAVTEVPASRWPAMPGVVARWGAFLRDPAGFDAGYFGLTDDEARAADPQARIFLELAHEALERAGYAGPRRRGRRIGVFVAVGESGYPELLARAAGAGADLPAPALVGNLRNLVAARVAQCLDLTGPALAVDTACSSALAALHLARRSIDAGECDLAVVGGVNLNLTPTGYGLLEAAQALSPTGRCHTFSAAADGFVPGEGGAAVVLGRLDDAHRHDDPVLALLRGTAMNNDGRSLSLMAPNPLLQREVIVEAYREAGVDPDAVSYVEAHGTGTAIGDPIELRSLTYAFAPRADGRPRRVGSVKTNIGHLLNAAGMPSLIKVLLALQHRQLPPSLHHTPPSPRLDLAGAGWAPVTELDDWAEPGPLLAGVNAFGFGGTNAHAILEQAPPPPVRERSAVNGPYLLTVSAHSAPALRAAVSSLAAHLRANPALDEADVCATTATSRDEGPHRLAVVAHGDLATRLAAGPPGTPVRGRPRLVFLLPGQGTLELGRGRGRYASAPVFRAVLDEASDLAGPVCGRSLTAWCLDEDVPPALLRRTEVTQPLLVALGIALARQFKAFGVTPDAVAGHSAGEIGAACVAGVLTVADAMRFAVARGRLMQDLAAPGAMAAVRGGAHTVADLVARHDGTLWVAAENGSGQVVVAGTEAAVERAVTDLAGRGVVARRLDVAHAFHTPMMGPVLEALAEVAGGLDVRPPTVPLLSTVTVQWNPPFDPAYLREHAVRPVRFGPAVDRLLDEGYDTAVELGFGSTLGGLVRAAAAQAGVDVLALPAARPGCDDGRALLETAGQLWMRGVHLDRTVLDAGRARVAVPTYPFQRRPYWVGTPSSGRDSSPGTDGPPGRALLHRLVWEPVSSVRGADPRVVWLLGPDSRLTGALADRLAGRGICVHRPGNGHTPPPAAPESVVLLAGPAVDIDSVAALDAARDAAVSALHGLIGLLGDARPRVLVVTEDVHATGYAVERLRPAQALLAGLGLALPDELSGLTTRVVDLSSVDGRTAHLEALDVELVTGEVSSGPARHLDVVAWRGGRRLVRTQVAVVADGAAPVPLAVDGVYLITGGAGGVGAALARHLARELARPTLVLAGRSPAAPAGLLDELAALGAEARYRVADVSVAADADALIAGVPRLDGVFHAAGVIHPGALRLKSRAEIEAVLAPKVRGSYLLARALRRHGRRPAVCVAFSSIAAVLPGFAGALGDYAAANAFLDAFAAAERAAGHPWQALNFAAFAEVGLAAAAGLGAAITTRGVPLLGTREALQALHAARGVDAGQLLVADLSAAAADAGATGVIATGAVATGAVATGRVAVGGVAPVVADVVRRLLAAALQRRAGDIGDDEPFLGLGLDSLTAVDLVKRLERELGRQLPTTLFFEYRTVGELVTHLCGAPGDHPVPAALAGQGGDLPFPLTPVQRAFHTNGRLYPDVAAYGYVRQTITGPLDAVLLGRALAHLEARHPMLRLRIEQGTAGPRQGPAPAAPSGTVPGWYESTDLRGSVEDLEESLCNRPFDLATEAPVRAVLARDGDRAHLILVLHHAAGDGFSLNVLGEELWQTYTALSQGIEPTLPRLDATFGDYAAAVEADRSSPEFARDLRYWQDTIGGRASVLVLPYDGDPGGPPASPFATHRVTLDRELTARLREQAAAADASLFHLLLAGYTRCLSRWSGQREVAVNVARAGREIRLPGIERLVGSFADTLPVFTAVDLNEPAPLLADRLRTAWLASERHARVASLDLARLCAATGSGPRTVSPATFSFARFPATTDPACPVSVTATSAGTASAATRLGLLCWESGETLHFSWNFPTRLFTRATVARFAREHLAELTAITGTPPASITDRLVAQFRRTPDAIAVDAGDTTMTYAELHRASDRLAARLCTAGVGTGDPVGLLTGPGIDTVVAIVGILRAGAAWVPLDAAHPQARLIDQLTRSGARTLVHDAVTGTLAGDFAGITRVPVDDAAPLPAHRPVVVDPVVGAEDLAYVIFTSGSTGRPKAVPITHRAMANYLDWALGTFGYGPGDRLAQTASICFDASVRQVLAPLLAGATVVTLTRDLVRDPDALLTYVERGRITVWSSVPTLWERLLSAAQSRVRRGDPAPDLSSLRWVHVGGEALSAAHVRRWYDLFGPGPRIANLYGPTESTINATCHIVDTRPADDARQVPIGRPIAGTRVEVVDGDGRRCLPGEPGELLIGGIGLTPGYLGAPELDAAAFTERDGQRWYRSGDQVRQGPGGVLEFLGRLDDQVKIRGHRVELGEIEAVLHTHPGVARAAVLRRPDRVTGMDRVIAFVEPRPAADPPAASELRAHLAVVLPDYMLPARIHVVGELPLTGTGKVDRAGLLSPRPGTLPQEPPTTGTLPQEPPKTGTERLLAPIWCAVLDVPAVGRDDDFFTLGGDSIGVLEVFARLEHLVPVLPRPTVIYAHGTLAALAAVIDTTATTEPPHPDPPHVEPVPAGGGWSSPFPLSPTQRGFLLAEVVTPGADSAWLSCFRLHGALDPDRFQRAVDLLVVRHPMLRTVFPAGMRPPVQQELPPTLRLPVDYEVLPDAGSVTDRVAAERARRFDPWAWPLLRLRLLALAPDQHLLVVHGHHLIGDGYSAAVLYRELLIAYDRVDDPGGPRLPALRGTFREYVALLEREAATGTSPAPRDAPDGPPVLRATAWHPDPGPSHAGGFTVDADQVDLLRRLGKTARATLYGPLLTAYYRALVTLTGRDDLVLGLAVTGRDVPLPDVARVFGPFATAVAVRLGAAPGTCRAGRTFGDDLRHVVAEVAAARVYGATAGRPARRPDGVPLIAQFFFTFLDFASLGPATGENLTLSWDADDTALEPPPVGTDTFLAVRPIGAELRVTLRASSAAFTSAAFDAFVEALRAELAAATTGGAARSRPREAVTTSLDAALVGYLPCPADVTALAGLPPGSLPREPLRQLLFPDGGPRLLEEVGTPLGRSGFVCLPIFADELHTAPAGTLTTQTARGVVLAGSLGARSVSLAGMIPALTGYGFDVLRDGALQHTTSVPTVTTGHAATAVAVVRTVLAAVGTVGRDLGELAVAFVGLGSIGRTSLELLLTRAGRPPARLVLCDVAGSAPRLAAFADHLRARGLVDALQWREADPALPADVYGTDLIVAAVSGAGTVLDVDRLRPGTIVVDDSFPHCFDTVRAVQRMRLRQDVLVVGGGLLHCGSTQRRVVEGLPPAAGAAERMRPPGTIASCQLESLLLAAVPGLAPVHGLVDAALAEAYWDAVEAAGVSAAPLHLLDHMVDGTLRGAIVAPS